jgi:hypothetical protein
MLGMSWVLIILAGIVLSIWWNGLGAREIARNRGKRMCDEAGLLFLDDTVCLQRLRLVMYRKQKLGLYRRFVFEFATDGEQRYQGHVDMFNHYVIDTDMQPYRVSQ